MSTVIYATPVFSNKVRYNRKEEEDGGKREEREVVIYESADDIRDDHSDLQPQEGVQTKSFRAALCLGVLSLLILAGIIILSTRYVLVTLEKTQLQIRYKNLNNTYNQLQDDYLINYTQLRSSYNTLSNTHRQSLDEVKKLKDIIQGKLCPEGWTRFGCSCYLKSTDKKTWSESRTDCENRGSDLVSINSKEELGFVIKLNENEESWIGLRSERTQNTDKWKWEWVDGSAVSET
ncbi:C-type lectin domain family 7 member A-like [Anabas testudineus]|uniref:C-type lectin domain family 7 member A-like n=1 Tax=Anabas testudineus TaxID=64144 RepID=UPI000E45B167|nr:C-type lectin domain family 7 member A-like [Anabas testudineus]